jgi:Arc/MetJ-type ribon-helix-helix transcriptional regulator
MRAKQAPEWECWWGKSELLHSKRDALVGFTWRLGPTPGNFSCVNFNDPVSEMVRAIVKSSRCASEGDLVRKCVAAQQQKEGGRLEWKPWGQMLKRGLYVTPTKI